MNNSYITIIKEKRTDLSRKRIPLNQNGCTADFRMSVPFEQNLQLSSSYNENTLFSIEFYSMYAAAVFQLILAIGLGTIFSWLLTKTGLTFPIYIGAMIAAALIRNISEYTGHFTIHMGEINDLGGISLSLFLGMAMITLKLWELSELALPLIVLLASQVILIALFTYFIEFNIMGRDYDAAVVVAGTCGFGLRFLSMFYN